ncbi:hypothetical protein C8F04DRAFT_1184852 [Mycena alexandri]|uniref:Uncharacterized protein n=1 Tax=Mycena alexandri TaxID=1745969 RepID=A0AAD6X1V8_9AGAR|nr:hypothetical protein C8F04DRAFT_1184852 [Mycena alexandri]
MLTNPAKVASGMNVVRFDLTAWSLKLGSTEKNRPRSAQPILLTCASSPLILFFNEVHGPDKSSVLALFDAALCRLASGLSISKLSRAAENFACFRPPFARLSHLMHPALRLSALDVPPYTVKLSSPAIVFQNTENSLTPSQRTALAAAAGSEEDLYEMQRLIADTHFNDDGEKLRLFLPVFYANLDRAKIPISDGLDDPSIFTAGPVHLAMISLQQICTMTLFIPLPSDIFSDLWPKLWKWVQFFDAYRFIDDETGPGITFVKFVSMFLPDEITRGILTSTSGVRRMVARSWILLLQTSNPVVGYGFDALTMILHSPVVVASRTDAEEFIEGAGGGVEDLASLIVGYVDRVAQDNFELGGEIFNFIDNVQTSLGVTGPEDSNGMVIGPLHSALRAADIVTSLTRMIHNLMRNNASAYTTHIPHFIA